MINPCETPTPSAFSTKLFTLVINELADLNNDTVAPKRKPFMAADAISALVGAGFDKTSQPTFTAPNTMPLVTILNATLPPIAAEAEEMPFATFTAAALRTFLIGAKTLLPFSAAKLSCVPIFVNIEARFVTNDIVLNAKPKAACNAKPWTNPETIADKILPKLADFPSSLA